VAKATLQQTTGWTATKGADPQIFFQYAYSLVPTADYELEDSKIDIAFAETKYAKDVDYTRFKRALSGVALTY